MAEFYIGQIMMTGFSYAQKYFAQCNGQILPIGQNQALFSLLGTVYGGNGVTTFALPDLRSRAPAGGGFPSADPGWQPPGYPLGQVAGTETVTLTITNLPPHTHNLTVTSDAGQRGVPRGAGMTLATVQPDTAYCYGAAGQMVPLGGDPLGPAGGTQPHPNIQPCQAINFNIALSGIFPSRN